MAAISSPSPWYPGFKAAVFALLACNTAYYLFGSTWTQGLDALAWLTLLALFALETGFDGRLRARPRDTLAERPVAGTGAKARCPQTAGFASNESARPRDTLAERPVAGTGAKARCPQTAGFASNESARPRDTLAERPVAGTGAKARCPQTAGFASNESARRAVAAIRGLRLAAAAAVGAAAIGYAVQNEWLDAINTALWIAVVVLLEFEVRNSGAVARHPVWFTATAVTLYAGLAALVLVWAWRGEWFDAYDAALWLTAFAMIEMDVLRVPRGEATV